MNKPNLHWKSLEKRTIYKNPWVEIYSEDLELPGEHILEDFVTLKFQDWAAVVALTNRQSKHDPITVSTEVEQRGIPYYAMAHARDVLPMIAKSCVQTHPVHTEIQALL